METEKSVITCDMEGRIETFSNGAEELFGYRADEVVGKKRVSLFSPGLIVLGHVPGWLASASARGEFATQTVFVRKDGTQFAADIKITPTFRKEQQIGYCGVTVPRPDVPVARAMPRISAATRVFAGLVVTRAPFLTAIIVPILVGAALVSWRGVGPFAWGRFGLALLGGMLLHAGANVLNDYFDWSSGTDPGNNEYFLPFSGGSRAVELGLATERALLVVGLAALAGAAAVGALLWRAAGNGVLWFGLAGAFAAVFYTAPPLRLAARRGLGELAVGLCFGPLATAGTVYALTGAARWADFLVGLPAGLLTIAILFINEFPDAPADARAGKNHLVVTLGRARARFVYPLFTFGAFVAAGGLFLGGVIPATGLALLLAAPLAWQAARICFAHYDDRALVSANAKTIQLQLAAGTLLAAGIALARFVH